MDKFYCQKCKKIFIAKGQKKEWQDPIYGRCWKYEAKCPDCGGKCSPYYPERKKVKTDS